MLDRRPNEPEKIVQFLYTNYRDETAVRTVIPERIWYGSTPWHPEQQWLLEAFDLDRAERRSFALAAIHKWSEQGRG